MTKAEAKQNLEAKFNEDLERLEREYAVRAQLLTSPEPEQVFVHKREAWVKWGAYNKPLTVTEARAIMAALSPPMWMDHRGGKWACLSVQPPELMKEDDNREVVGQSLIMLDFDFNEKYLRFYTKLSDGQIIRASIMVDTTIRLKTDHIKDARNRIIDTKYHIEGADNTSDTVRWWSSSGAPPHITVFWESLEALFEDLK